MNYILIEVKITAQTSFSMLHVPRVLELRSCLQNKKKVHGSLPTDLYWIVSFHPEY